MKRDPAAASLSSLEAILQTAADGIVTADDRGLVVSWNPAAAGMFGFDEDEIVGQPLWVLVPERFRDAHRHGLARVVSTGETRIIGKTVDVFGLHKDGHEFPIELSLATWIDEGRRFFSGIIRDVSARVEMNDELSRSEKRLQAIMKSANDAMISIDGRGKVLMWNPAAAEMFGYSELEMMGEPLNAIIPERFRLGHLEGVERVVAGGERHVIGTTVELAGLHKDGSEFPMELSLATWNVGDQSMFSGIIRDITERKTAEEAVRLANKALSEKNDQLEALSAKLAKYLSRQVYDSIFEGRTDVQVQSYRKELSIFFSDIQGFTALTDRLEAEVLSELLNTYLSEMSQIADECGGTIDKFIGDGIMIFFGDPETKGRREDALACVRMALRMRERSGQLRKDWADMIGPDPLHVRLGINTGYCTVGNFGSQDRLDYTIVGGAVNVAARLEETAAPDQIQISHTTYSLVKDEIYCRPIGDIRVKGVSHDMRTYEVVGDFDNLKERGLIEEEGDGFNLVLDPAELSPDEARRARRALQDALQVLGGPESGD
jgi:PAS domain S-box-containing protein